MCQLIGFMLNSCWYKYYNKPVNKEVNIICFTQIATFNIFYIDKWEAEYTLLFLAHVLFESQNHPIEMVHPCHGPHKILYMSQVSTLRNGWLS